MKAFFKFMYYEGISELSLLRDHLQVALPARALGDIWYGQLLLVKSQEFLRRFCNDF